MEVFIPKSLPTRICTKIAQILQVLLTKDLGYKLPEKQKRQREAGAGLDETIVIYRHYYIPKVTICQGRDDKKSKNKRR